MSRRALSIALILTFVVALPNAAAEPTRNLSPSECVTDKGSEFRLEPGVHYPEPEWLKVDKEVRRLQDAETRLKAENKVLRKEVSDGWGTRALILGALTVGFAAGWGLSR